MAQEPHHTKISRKMVTPSYLKPLKLFSSKPLASSTLNSTMKIKTLIHTLVTTQVYRNILRALSKAKTLIVGLIKENHLIHYLIYSAKKKQNRERNKIFFGSFRLHYNWCSSAHILPIPAGVLEGFSKNSKHFYYDSTWNTSVNCGGEIDNAHEESHGLSGYLDWLEEKSSKSDDSDKEQVGDNVDRLAELFIASRHEQFMLEKQESYRRFQEMMARSM